MLINQDKKENRENALSGNEFDVTRPTFIMLIISSIPIVYFVLIKHFAVKRVTNHAKKNDAAL